MKTETLIAVAIAGAMLFVWYLRKKGENKPFSTLNFPGLTSPIPPQALKTGTAIPIYQDNVGSSKVPVVETDPVISYTPADGIPVIDGEMA